VLGESYDRGWRASCNGHDLGAPTVIDGYANGWRVGPGCTSVDFSFAPNRLALVGYLVSIIATLLCALLAARQVQRARRRAGERHADASPASRPGPLSDRAATPLPLAHAAIAGLICGMIAAFVFGVQAGVPAAPAVALLLWRGVGARALTLAAGGLLTIAVPVLYLLTPGSPGAGDQSGYPTDHISAHWVGVAALILLMIALWRSLQSARAQARGSASPT